LLVVASCVRYRLSMATAARALLLAAFAGVVVAVVVSSALAFPKLG
jgi:hypothetical protein